MTAPLVRAVILIVDPEAVAVTGELAAFVIALARHVAIIAEVVLVVWLYEHVPGTPFTVRVTFPRSHTV